MFCGKETYTATLFQLKRPEIGEEEEEEEASGDAGRQEEGGEFALLSFALVLGSVGNFFGSDFGVRLHWGIALIGSGNYCEVFLVSLTDRALARCFANEFPHRSTGSGSAQRARHCGLSKSVLLGALWRVVCF